MSTAQNLAANVTTGRRYYFYKMGVNRSTGSNFYTVSEGTEINLRIVGCHVTDSTVRPQITYRLFFLMQFPKLVRVLISRFTDGLRHITCLLGSGPGAGELSYAVFFLLKTQAGAE